MKGEHVYEHSVKSTKKIFEKALQTKETVFLWGPSTEYKPILNEMKKELNFGVVEIFTPRLAVYDIIVPGGDGEWFIAEFWPKDKDKGFIYVEDFGHASLEIQHLLFKMTITRKIGNSEIVDGWSFIIQSCNPWIKSLEKYIREETQIHHEPEISMPGMFSGTMLH